MTTQIHTLGVTIECNLGVVKGVTCIFLPFLVSALLQDS